MNTLLLRRWLHRVVLVAAATSVSAGASAEVLVVSQNTLHLGQNSRAVPNYIVAKNRFIQSLAQWPGHTLPQLTFLQEVMIQADSAAITPPGAVVHFGPLQGGPRYKERYGVLLVNDAGNHAAILCHVETASLVTPGVKVDRPPDATLVSDTSGSTRRLIWFLSFHATFTGGLAARRAEVAEVGRIVASLTARTPAGCPATTPNVVVMGDWNLAADDGAFEDLERNAGFRRPLVSPNALTSINNRTGRLASAYDHFVWDDARVQVTLAALPARSLCATTLRIVSGVITPASVPAFLRNCSDHLGIAATIRVR